MARNPNMLSHAFHAPCGEPIFGNIIQNGDRAQESENVWMNQASRDMYFYRLLDVAMSLFNWQNLPKGIDTRMLEYWLLFYGCVAIFYDKELADTKAGKDGFVALPVTLSGELDTYMYPTEPHAFSPNGQVEVKLSDKNSVIMFNDYLRVPMINTLALYAQRLAEIDRTIDVNVHAQKTPKVIKCDDAKRLTFKNIGMQYDGNVYTLCIDKNTDISDIELLDLSAPYVSNDLQVLKHQLWNEALTFLGVENANTDKKERLVSSEVYTNMGDVEAQRYTRINPRKQALEQCKERFENFPKDANVEFKSGIYIRNDGTADMRTDGTMQEEAPGGDAQ